MKGMICYYTGTGNTKAACESLARQIPEVSWDWHDIVRQGTPALHLYDVTGFATFTDFWGVPEKFRNFAETLPMQPGKPAFVLNTFGMISLFTLRDMSRLLRQKKFTVVAGFSLHTPENYPPMIVGNMAMAHSPSPEELDKFKAFTQKLGTCLADAKKGRPMKNARLGNPWLSWIPAPGRRMSKNSMGAQSVDTSLCTKCGICEQSCPYQAIAMQPFPVFDHKKCFGCWACFNRCPSQAVYTKKIRGKGQYPKPLPQLLKKLFD